MCDNIEFTALFLWGNRTIVLYNNQNNSRMLGNMKLFLVLNGIFWSTLEINIIFPNIHVVVIIVYIYFSNRI